MGWEINPPGLRELVLDLGTRYSNLPPLYITENGAAFEDVLHDGAIRDDLRTAYIMDHLDELAKAIESGADVRGYFLWSFLDNFEWSYGYSKRFGIVHVDYASQTRTPKASARAYADRIRATRAG